MKTGKGVTAEARGNDGSIGVSRSAWLPGTEAERERLTLDPLPSDDAFEILRNPRRRHAIRILARCDGAIGLSDLASGVASIENGKRPEDVNATERKRVYISLYQCHVSKMVEAGIIEYDEDARLVAITDRGDELAAILESFGSEPEDDLPLLPAVAAGALGLSLASFLGSLFGLAMLFLGVGISFALFSVIVSDANRGSARSRAANSTAARWLGEREP